MMVNRAQWFHPIVGKPHFLRASTRNSTSARWASKSSTGRNCRRCSVHGKTRDCRNSTARHCTSSVAHRRARRGLIPSNHKRERCCRAADDSRAGSRSRASDRCGPGQRARRTQWLAATTRALHLIGRMCATLAQRTRRAIQMRQVARNLVSQPSPLGFDQPNDDLAAEPQSSAKLPLLAQLGPLVQFAKRLLFRQDANCWLRISVFAAEGVCLARSAAPVGLYSLRSPSLRRCEAEEPSSLIRKVQFPYQFHSERSCNQRRCQSVLGRDSR